MAAEQGHKDVQASLLEMKNTKETLKVKGFYIGMGMDKWGDKKDLCVKFRGCQSEG
jgi:hypothetical protein